MLSEYNSLKYHPWQSRLLLLSSSCFLSVGVAAIVSLGQPLYGCLIVSSGVASLNYWRRPGAGPRRDLDLLLALLALGYGVVAGFGVNGIANTCAWPLFLSLFFCFRQSWKLSAGDGGDGTWALFHAGAHVSCAATATCQCIGDVDGWRANPARLSVRGNPLATATICVVAAVLGADFARSLTRTNRPKGESSDD